ncbi:MAG: hypothetical protein SWH54_16440 [Thermodesulfobacteriota bacterium]|nr:hypothetical protein [Thermodesulfobacteriota bacterium]
MENKKEDEIFRGDENDILYNRVGPDEDPEIADLVSRTVEVLKSDMDCSASLAAIIRSFHHTMRAEREVSKLKSRITAIEERQKKSEEIRKEDPPEKKEEFLKRRAM